MQSIDLTPSWHTATQIYIEVLRNPDATFEGVKAAKEELLRMAKIADRYLAEQSNTDES